MGSANPTVQGGLYASYRLLPFLSLGIDAAFRNFFGLSTDVSLSLGASYHFYFSSPAILELSEPELRVFPILFKYYDKNRISTITLRNQTDQPIRDITVQFFSQEFMVNPKLCAAPFRLAPGEEKLLEVYGLFTDKMLTVSEGTKVSANISVDFQFKGKDYSKNLVTTLDVISRNGIIWDDDRKASCFVTAKDPSVLRFSKTVSALLRDRPVMEFDHALLKAMVLHSALNLYGLAYMQDPSTPYAEFSQRRTAVDFLQFPNQTLEYKGGDCDDLSILYSALLESLGIETAFITIPGHIFMAFRLSSDEKSIRSNFRNSTDFIIREDGVWIPVEVTSISNGFLKAWQMGAQEWNEAVAVDEAAFYPVHEAWQEYEPVGFLSMQSPVTLPADNLVMSGFKKELERLIKREVEPRITGLKAKISASPNQLKLQNSLGVLYARYGMLDQALRVFNNILQKEDYTPAFINRGNIFYLNRDFIRARESYREALERLPDHPRLLLTLTKVEQQLQNTDQALAYYERLKELSPQLAEQVSNIEKAKAVSGRSEDIGEEQGAVLWEE